MAFPGLLAVVTVVFYATSVDAAASTTSLQVLNAIFGDQIKMSGSRVKALSYCPDNTCEIFRARVPQASDALADFALLYLWYLSDYTDLEPWHRGPAPPQVATVRERHSVHCAHETERARTRCAFIALAKKAHITLAFIRYDEGATNEAPMSLSVELKRLK